MVRLGLYFEGRTYGIHSIWMLDKVRSQDYLQGFWAGATRKMTLPFAEVGKTE